MRRAPIVALFALLLLVPGRAAGASFQAATDQPSQPPPDSAPPPAQENPGPPAQTERPPEQPTPNASKAPETPKPEASAKPETKKPTTVAKKPSTAAKKKRRPRPVAKTNPDGTPTKRVVRNGGAGDPKVQLTPDLSQQQASEQRKQTDQLLNATDANLQKLAGHPLSPSQQDVIKQVKAYEQQAKAAIQDGDFQGAHNLALKARLLSEDLAKK